MRSVIWTNKKLSSRGGKKFDFLYLSKKYGFYSVLTSILFLGMLAGIVAAKNADISLVKGLDVLFISNFEVRAEQSLFETFSASLTAYFIFTLVLFMSGISSWGALAVPPVLFAKGFGIGITSGFLFSAYGASGIAFYMLVLLPGAFLSSVAVIMQGKIAFGYANIIFKSIISSEGNSLPNKCFKSFMLRTSFSLILTGLAAITDVVFTSVFAGMFKF